MWKKKKKKDPPPGVEFNELTPGRLDVFSLRFGWFEVYESGRHIGLFDSASDFEDWCRHLEPDRKFLVIFRFTNQPDPSRLWHDPMIGPGIVGQIRWKVQTTGPNRRPRFRTVTATEGRRQ